MEAAAKNTAQVASPTKNGDTKMPEIEKAPNQYADMGAATQPPPRAIRNPPATNSKTLKQVRQRPERGAIAEKAAAIWVAADIEKSNSVAVTAYES